MTPEVELIRALAEDLALEILASYTPTTSGMPTSQAWGKRQSISQIITRNWAPRFKSSLREFRKPRGRKLAAALSAWGLIGLSVEHPSLVVQASLANSLPQLNSQ